MTKKRTSHEKIARSCRRPRSTRQRTVALRSLRVLLIYLQLSGKARLMFRDMAGEDLRRAESEFRRGVWIADSARKEMQTPLSAGEVEILRAWK
jgi:hypothetical protein